MFAPGSGHGPLFVLKRFSGCGLLGVESLPGSEHAVALGQVPFALGRFSLARLVKLEKARVFVSEVENALVENLLGLFTP